MKQLPPGVLVLALVPLAAIAVVVYFLVTPGDGNAAGAPGGDRGRLVTHLAEQTGRPADAVEAEFDALIARTAEQQDTTREAAEATFFDMLDAQRQAARLRQGMDTTNPCVQQALDAFVYMCWTSGPCAQGARQCRCTSYLNYPCDACPNLDVSCSYR